MRQRGPQPTMSRIARPRQQKDLITTFDPHVPRRLDNAGDFPVEPIN